jgi:EpsI family protein
MNRSRPFVLTVALLAVTLTAAALAARRPSDVLTRPLETIPDQLEGWSLLRSNVLNTHVLQVLAPTNYLARTYRKGGVPLDLFIAYYSQQRAGESMHSPKNCIPGSGWEISHYGSAMLPLAGGAVKVNKFTIQNGRERSLVYYWYQSRTRIIANEYMGKILLVRDAFVEGYTAGSLVRVIVPDSPSAAEEGANFSAALIPYVQRCFIR